MAWIDNYDLFLFDFDGLLVNTEFLHYSAYKKMCKDRGFDLNWTFEKYIETAHYRSEGLERQIYNQFPALQKMEPNWPILYQEKKRALIQIYENDPIPLMRGVEKMIRLLKISQKKIAVVTNSDKQLITIIKDKNSILAEIPHWITREDYILAKPNPECYLKAIRTLSHDGERVVGFEDTPRGLQALRGTNAKAIIVTEIKYPELPRLIESGVSYYPSFDEVLSSESL